MNLLFSGYYFLYGEKACAENKGEVSGYSCQEKLVCLYISDDYEFMDRELQELLKSHVYEYVR